MPERDSDRILVASGQPENAGRGKGDSVNGRSHGRRRSLGAARGPRRGGDCPNTHDHRLRLGAGQAVAMGKAEEERLVGMLAGLLADWLTEHPEEPPTVGRPVGGESRAKERA